MVRIHFASGGSLEIPIDGVTFDGDDIVFWDEGVELGRQERSQIDRIELTPQPIRIAPEAGKSYDVEEIRKDSPKAYEKWTDEEEAELIRLRDRGVRHEEIAKTLGRQVGGVKSRLKHIAERDENGDSGRRVPRFE